MRRLLITVFLALILSITVFVTVSAASDSDIKFNINGNENHSVKAQIVNQTTLVPLRAINDNFDYLQTAWNSESKTVLVTSSKTNQVLEIAIGSNVAYLNGQQILLSTPAKIIDGITYVPLRFISENMGLIVYWDQATKYVVIYDVDPKNDTDLKSADIVTARRATLSLPRVALCQLFTTDQEMLNNTFYYFPYGESKRFIVSFKDLMFYYEVRNNAAWLVWQGKEEPDISRQVAIPYDSSSIKQEWGAKPNFGNKISYFWDQYMVDVVQYGVIENGVTSQVGEIHVEDANYSVIHDILGEVKVD